MRLPGVVAAAGAMLVALESLWAFYNAVKASGLTCSMIRMWSAVVPNFDRTATR